MRSHPIYMVGLTAAAQQGDAGIPIHTILADATAACSALLLRLSIISHEVKGRPLSPSDILRIGEVVKFGITHALDHHIRNYPNLD